MKPFPGSGKAAGEASASPAPSGRPNGRTTTDAPSGPSGRAHSPANTFNFFRHRWLTQVARDPKLSGAAVRVAVLLWEHQNAERGYAWPSLAYMARELRMHRSTVIRSIDRLGARRWIMKEVSGGRHRSNRYRIGNGQMGDDGDASPDKSGNN